MIGGSLWMGLPLGLPLTLTLSPRAGERGPGGACGARTPSAAALGVFLYAFAKNERDNIEDDELACWHTTAGAYLQMSAARIEDQIEHDELREVMCDEQD